MYKVGDKVRLVETMTYGRIFDAGHVGTIVGLSTNASYRRVQYEGDTHDWRLVNVSAIELVVEDKRKFNVGDRVRVGSNGMLATVETITLNRDGVRYRIHYDEDAADVTFPLFRDAELTLHTPRTWSKPDASQSVGIDVIDSLVDEMTTTLRTEGGDCETRRFGDVMVVVENGQAKIYRLEASSEIG